MKIWFEQTEPADGTKRRLAILADTVPRVYDYVRIEEGATVFESVVNEYGHCANNKEMAGYVAKVVWLVGRNEAMSVTLILAGE